MKRTVTPVLIGGINRNGLNAVQDLVAKGNTDFPGRFDDVVVQGNSLHPANGLPYGNGIDVRGNQCNHAPKSTFPDQARSACAKAGAENAVKSCRRTPALQVAEDDNTCLLSGQFADGCFITVSATLERS